MAKVIYNLNSIRPPITGIGRYAIELIRGGLKSPLSVLAVYNRKLHPKDSLPNLLGQLEKPIISTNTNWRKYIGQIPLSREFYRLVDSHYFDYLTEPELRCGGIHHDINYNHRPLVSPAPSRTVTTVYDLSHLHYPQTHPRFRVRFLKGYFKRLASSNSHIITISHSIKNELIAHYGITPERIHVTYLAADETFYPRSRNECDALLTGYGLSYKRFILAVGTLEPRKNLESLLTAFCALNPITQKTYPLVLAGTQGWKSGRLTTEIDRLHEQGRIFKIGFVPQQHLPILYSSAKAFVYPSLYEGFGLPVIEAMQCGSAVITANSGALAEVSNDQALQVQPTNTEELAFNLDRILNDDELNNQYSLAGIARAKEFSWAKTVGATQKIYANIENR